MNGKSQMNGASDAGEKAKKNKPLVPGDAAATSTPKVSAEPTAPPAKKQKVEKSATTANAASKLDAQAKQKTEDVEMKIDQPKKAEAAQTAAQPPASVPEDANGALQPSPGKTQSAGTSPDANRRPQRHAKAQATQKMAN